MAQPLVACVVRDLKLFAWLEAGEILESEACLFLEFSQGLLQWGYARLEVSGDAVPEAALVARGVAVLIWVLLAGWVPRRCVAVMQWLGRVLGGTLPNLCPIGR